MMQFIIEFSILLGLFGICYIGFVRKNTSYNFQRGYILLTSIISAVLPFLPASIYSEKIIFSRYMPDIIINGTSEIAPLTTSYLNQVDIYQSLFYFYILVCIVLSARLFYAIFVLWDIFRHGQKEKINDLKIIKSLKIKNPCSFFGYILLPGEVQFSKDELQAIIEHESLHIQLGHSLEKVLLEINKIVFWWHPFSWLYAKEMELIHEYQVDEFMSHQMNPSKYKEILLQLIINPPQFRMVNPFSSNIKKRINIMNQKKRISSWTQHVGLLALLMMASFLIHSCQQEDTNKEVTVIDAQVSPRSSTSSFQHEVTDTFTTFNYDTYEESVKFATHEVTVYKEPDAMPLFPGCDNSLEGDALKTCSDQKLLEFIYKNITYPDAARKKGLEGMVLIQFIVGAGGKVYDTEFLKSPDVLFEQTVKDMLADMNKNITWIPGKVEGKDVDVQYTLPVKFKLEDK